MNELKEIDKSAVQRVSDMGWTKGGRDAMGLGENVPIKQGCPVMNHSSHNQSQEEIPTEPRDSSSA